MKSWHSQKVKKQKKERKKRRKERKKERKKERRKKRRKTERRKERGKEIRKEGRKEEIIGGTPKKRKLWHSQKLKNWPPERKKERKKDRKKEGKKKLLGGKKWSHVTVRKWRTPTPILFYILGVNVSCLHESIKEMHHTTLRCMKRDYCYRKKNISELILDSSISLKSSHPYGQWAVSLLYMTTGYKAFFVLMVCSMALQQRRAPV